MIPFAAFPPAAMRRDMASYYVSMRNLPEPSFYNGKIPFWLRDDLDKWLAEKAGQAPKSGMDWVELAGDGDHAP